MSEGSQDSSSEGPRKAAKRPRKTAAKPGRSLTVTISQDCYQLLMAGRGRFGLGQSELVEKWLMESARAAGLVVSIRPPGNRKAPLVDPDGAED